MTDNIIKSITKAEYLSNMELAGRLSTEIADRIDQALANDDREILRRSEFIPASPEDLDTQLINAIGRIQSKLEQTKEMMTDVGRAFTESAFTREFVAQRINQMRHNHHVVAQQKISIIADVHTGEGPLNQHTVETLSEMRDVLRAVAETASELPDTHDLDEAFAYCDIEEYKPIAALGLMISVEVSRTEAEYMGQLTGVEVKEHPLPSAEDVAALRDFAAAHDDVVARFLMETDPKSGVSSDPNGGF